MGFLGTLRGIMAYVWRWVFLNSILRRPIGVGTRVDSIDVLGKARVIFDFS